MESGDGLIMRLRPRNGGLSSKQVASLAHLVRVYGNGFVELTSRGNLQIRAINPADHPKLLADLAAIGLLDTSAHDERRPNIILNPFRNGADQGMADELAAGLARPEMPEWPSKFGFAIDPGADRHLTGISADIRIESASKGLILRADGAALGRKLGNAKDAVALALIMAQWFVQSGGIGPDGRGRMRRHLAAGAVLPMELRGDALPNPVAAPVRPGPYAGGFCVGAAFGILSAKALLHLADQSSSLYLTPFRMVFLPDRSLIAPHPEIITHDDDPLMRVRACPGAPGCAQSSVETRHLARALAGYVARDAILHVSGCAKGCAHPHKATHTLVGHNGQFDLVRHGTPWDHPAQRGLNPDDISEIQESL